MRIAGREVKVFVVLGFLFFLTGCAHLNTNFSGSLEKTQVAYEREGNVWGKQLKIDGNQPATNVSLEYTRDICQYVLQKEIEKVNYVEYMKKNNITNNDINADFIYRLYSPDKIDYFNVHPELKESFKKGFRLGYESRIADLVLGPHLTTTAACVGMGSSQEFVDVITVFEKGWVNTIRKAIDTFIVLISEGSQADREVFIGHFIAIYEDKWDTTQKLKEGGVMTQLSAGGTTLFIDMSKDSASAVMDIPKPDGLKLELYKQTFKVMGDEWGRRYATNLIRRDELVDLLRKVKPVLSEVGNSRENIQIVRDAFDDQYKADPSAFRSMVSDAGIDVALLQTPGDAPFAPVSGGKKK